MSAMLFWKRHCFPHLHKETLPFSLHWKSLHVLPSLICKSDVPGGPQQYLLGGTDLHKALLWSCVIFLTDGSKHMCRSAAGTWCAVKVILSKVHRDLEDLPGNISPFRALVRVRDYSPVPCDYSPVPCDVSQLKETNSNVVPSMEHRSSQGGGRTSIFITRNPSSLLLLPIFIPSFILFLSAGWLGRHLHDCLLRTSFYF